MNHQEKRLYKQLLSTLSGDEQRQLLRQAAALRKKEATTWQQGRKTATPKHRHHALEDESPSCTRIRAGEGRRSLDEIALELLREHGQAPTQTETRDLPAPITGLVISLSPGMAAVQVGKMTWLCRLHPDIARMQQSSVAVGDEVFLDRIPDATGTARVTGIRSRKTWLSRPDPQQPNRERVIAANVDIVVIVASLAMPAFRPRLIDRYLVATGRGGAKPLICLTKADLLTRQEERNALERRLAPYRALGITILMVSSTTREGLEHLRQHLCGKTCVMTGHSGVGKTSLLNALSDTTAEKTGQVRTTDGRGRHTTSSSHLHELDNGIRLIDTPGIREFGFWRLPPEEVRKWFPELEERASGCRFHDCSHRDEPDCAIRDAVRQGFLARERYISYRRLMDGQTNESSKDEMNGEMPQGAGFPCCRCGHWVPCDAPGTTQRNHCPSCLWSQHLDDLPGDRASGCNGAMEPVAVWVRKGGEWAIIHRCSACGTFHANRVAGDDNSLKLMSLAVRPLSQPPFPLEHLAGENRQPADTLPPQPTVPRQPRDAP